MAKTETTKPADLLWQEEQLKDDTSPKVLSTFGEDPNEGLQRPDDVDGYLGTDPIYQSAANLTERPFRSEKGAESKFEERAYGEKFSEQPFSEADYEADDSATGESDAESSTTPTPPSGLQSGITPPSGS